MIELCKKIKTNRKKFFLNLELSLSFMFVDIYVEEGKRNSVVAKVRKQRVLKLRPN